MENCVLLYADFDINLFIKSLPQPKVTGFLSNKILYKVNNDLHKLISTTDMIPSTQKRWHHCCRSIIIIGVNITSVIINISVGSPHSCKCIYFICIELVINRILRLYRQGQHTVYGTINNIKLFRYSQNCSLDNLFRIFSDVQQIVYGSCLLFYGSL